MFRILLLAAIVPFCACDNGATKSEAVHDVQHYLEHPDEREAMTIRCKNDPGELGDAPDCRNAGEADRRSLIDEIKAATGVSD